MASIPSLSLKDRAALFDAGPPPVFAGVDLSAPVLMGIVNVTPDSFSDGGETARAADAVSRGLRLMEEGAAIIDVGGESTRPGADPVAEGEELRRVLPVIEALAVREVVVSIDTRHAAVMRAALDAGAAIVNDVQALEGPGSLDVAAGSEAGVVLMHMRGEPATMNNDPHYADVVAEVRDYLAGRLATCEAAGIDRPRVAVDPGIGFGKTKAHNRTLLDHLDRFTSLGCPLLVGISRKMPESMALAVAAAEAGARILRVHDVAETRRALAERGLSPA